MGEIVVEGEVVRVTFESESSGFRVVKVRVEGRAEPMSVVGLFPAVAAGARVRITGCVETGAKHGEQLRASNVIELGPATLRGLERYLGSGSIKGIGAKSAVRIVKHFGLEALQVLDGAPERLTEVEGLGKARAQKIAGAWREQRGVREVMVFLQAHGASLSLAQRIHKRFGAAAMSVVSREPYRLAMEVSGIGFATADRVANSVGIAADSPERVQAGLLHVVSELTVGGHCHSPESELFERAVQLLGEPCRPQLARALHAVILAGHLAVTVIDGANMYSTRAVWSAEIRLAARIRELAKATPTPIPGASELLAKFEQSQGIALAPEQRAAALAAASSSVLVVTGGPGVGKTTVLRAILAVLAASRVGVRLAAPTGRAAKRMTETTSQQAQTLHRLLEFDPRTGGFKRGQAMAIEAGAVIVDEASMIDLLMADSLTQAVPIGARLILVGDVDQLPSIGPGAVLRDVIASGAVPCVRLVHIYRQASESLIVANAHLINAGELPRLPAAGDDSSDFFMTLRADPESAKQTVLDLVTERIPRRFGFDPSRDVQVLVPMNRGQVGSFSLNEALQARLNPSGASLVRGDKTLRVGDKVMQLRNDYDKEVWNGDLGQIESVDAAANSLAVRFDDRRVSYQDHETDDLTLAYACTIHKSQGSEYAAVVVVMLSSHFVMLSKSLLYTAITRGKRLVVLVTDHSALRVSLGRDRRGDRRTRLAGLLAAAGGP